MVGQAAFAGHQVEKQGDNFFNELSEKKVGYFGRHFYGVMGSAFLVAAIAGTMFGTLTPFSACVLGVSGALFVAGATTNREIYPAMASIFTLGLIFAGL